MAFLRRLPKTELHLHLDGSLPFAFVAAQARERRVELPVGGQALRDAVHARKAAARRADASNAQQVSRKVILFFRSTKNNVHFLCVTSRCFGSSSLVCTLAFCLVLFFFYASRAPHLNVYSRQAGGNWGVFDWCNQFLQTRVELRDASRMICEGAWREHNVLRTELRFCPALHTLEALSPRNAVDAVVEGVMAASSESASVNGVIICALRSHDARHSMDMAQLAIEANRDLGGVVCGFDIAGDEGSFPLELHRGAVELCKAHGLPVTVHAGEWPGSINNVSLALAMGVDRIGHGWAMAEDPAVMEECRRRGVVVEVCLTSNVKPGAGPGWIESYEDHPVRKMVDAGVKICLNSDNHLLSGAADRPAHPTGEIQHLMSDCRFTLDEVVQILRNGVEAAFVQDASAKEQLVARFDAELEKVMG